jgi:hypothetical protein
MDDRHSKIGKKKKKKPCAAPQSNFDRKKKTSLSEFELPTGCKPVKLLATAIAAISCQSSCLPTTPLQRA